MGLAVMKMTKLKPCPFCGGMRPHACICAQRWAVRCPECGAMVMSDSADDGGKSAAKRWNARASEEDRRTVRTCHMRDASWDDGRSTWGCICSACGAKHEHERSRWMNFCPNCGAKVTGVEE